MTKIKSLLRRLRWRWWFLTGPARGSYPLGEEGKKQWRAAMDEWHGKEPPRR